MGGICQTTVTRFRSYQHPLFILILILFILFFFQFRNQVHQAAQSRPAHPFGTAQALPPPAPPPPLPDLPLPLRALLPLPTVFTSPPFPAQSRIHNRFPAPPAPQHSSPPSPVPYNSPRWDTLSSRGPRPRPASFRTSNSSGFLPL